MHIGNPISRPASEQIGQRDAAAGDELADRGGTGGQAGTEEPLVPGMFLSNEPGYYKVGHFGIRTENLILVEERTIEGAEGRYFGFETLTFVPIARDMVDCALLTRDEVEWWNAYHARVRDLLGPRLDGAALAWLEIACAPL